MTYKVNRITRFINSFSKTGRQANKEISNMIALPLSDTVYQKRLSNGSIALMKNNVFSTFKRDLFCLIKKDGSVITKSTQNSLPGNNEKFKFHYSVKQVLNSYGQKIKLMKRSVLYRLQDGKIEETAKKVSVPGGPSELIVRSAAGRISEFPATTLGGRIHPAVATKSELPNGDVIYREYYPYS